MTTTPDAVVVPRPPGRPALLLEPHTQKILVDALIVGATVRLACEAASIAQSTFHGWVARGYEGHEKRAAGVDVDEKEDRFIDLYLEVTKARATAALRNVGVIQRVANGGTVLERTTERDPDGTERVIEKRQAPDWRAAAWYLQHSYRGDFEKDAERLEISGPGGGAIPVGEGAAELSGRLAEFLSITAAAATAAADEYLIVDGEVVEEEPGLP